MKKSFFLLPLLLAAALLLSACGASVPDATQSLTESMLSALSDDDFAAAAELLDSESGLGENNIRSYIYALEAETDCDFSNGARVVGYTAYEDYTDESAPDEQRELHRTVERIVLRGCRAAERRERIAHRAAVNVVLREQPARESAQRALFEPQPLHCRPDKPGELARAAAQDIEAHGVPLLRAAEHKRRERGDVALAAVRKVNKIKNTLDAVAADGAHHCAVERIFRKPPILGLERRGERVPAERIAAPRIVDDVPAAAAAESLSGGVFTVTDRARPRDENAPGRLHRAPECNLMVAAEKELSGKAVCGKLCAQNFSHRSARNARAADAYRAARTHIAAEREDLPHATAEAVLADGGKVESAECFSMEQRPVRRADGHAGLCPAAVNTDNKHISHLTAPRASRRGNLRRKTRPRARRGNRANNQTPRAAPYFRA